MQLYFHLHFTCTSIGAAATSLGQMHGDTASTRNLLHRGLSLTNRMSAPRDGHFAWVLSPINLNAGAGPLLQAIDGIASFTNDATYHRLGAVHAPNCTELHPQHHKPSDKPPAKHTIHCST
jgi:hypothetical protein